MDKYRRRLLQFTFASMALPAAAQRAKVFLIGIVGNTFPAEELAKGTTELPGPRIITQGLRELGWIDGVNVRIIWKTVEGRYERTPEVIGELVQMRVDVIVVFGERPAAVALEKTRTIPIVHASPGSLLRAKLVSSLSRPGGNLTGISGDGLPGLNGKRLALLKAAAERMTHVAVLGQFIPSKELPLPEFSQETESAARTLGLTLLFANFERPGDMPAAIAEAVRKGANGMLVVVWSYVHYLQTQLEIHRQAVHYKLPTIYSTISAAESGGLMAYEAAQDIDRNVPRFIDKILRGVKPGDIPIEQPQKFDFVINAVAARAIGLSIPAAVLTQADRVIERSLLHAREIISPAAPR